MIRRLPARTERVLGYEVEGKLTGEELKAFIPEMEEAMARYGTVNFLIVLRGTPSYDLAGFVEDFKFCFRHWKEMGRVALVGPSGWIETLTKAQGAVVPWEQQYFGEDELEAAWNWALGG